MQFKRVALVLAFLLVASTASARQFDDRIHKGTIEIGGFSGFLLQRQTLEDPDAAGDSFSSSAATFGGDLAFYTSPRLGLGLYLTGQSFGFGPSSEHFSLSSTLIGPQLKYRVPVGDKVGVTVAGAGGMAINKTKFDGSNVDPFDKIDDKTNGTFMLGGATVNFFLADKMSLDAGVRYQFTRISSKDGNVTTKMNVSGLLGGLGFTVYLR